MIVYLNGEYLPREQARVSVEDRGFLFGDGIYEVIRASRGGLFQAEPHLERMKRGLRSLEIAFRPNDVDRLLDVSERLLRENDRMEAEATVYLQVTRGVATRSHCFPPQGCPPTVFAASADFVHPPEIHETGAAIITRPDQRWARCDLKTINLLPNVLGKQKAVEAGATEAVFVRDGVLTEGASTNLFAVMGGTLRTYPASNYILRGITRDLVMELAAERDIPVREIAVLHEELADVEELFLTGTTTDVLPVIEMDGRPVGDGRPGPITQTLQAALASRIAEVGVVAV